jgi:hypothetical protein
VFIVAAILPIRRTPRTATPQFDHPVREVAWGCRTQQPLGRGTERGAGLNPPRARQYNPAQRLKAVAAANDTKFRDG